jgi:hypothetical protein
VFEGRDAAGKGGTIKRFMEHLNPRGARVVALEKPTDRGAGSGTSSATSQHLPHRGEIVLFDRSWYNRAGVERVMGFCTQEQYDEFMKQAPEFERLLVDAGTTSPSSGSRSRRGSSGRGSRSARSTRCGAGSCRRSTSSRWDGGTTTPPPRRR